MLSEMIQPEDLVDVTVLQEALGEEGQEESEEKEEQHQTYRTKVCDILSEDKLEIMMPDENGKLILLPVDAQVNMCFHAEQGLFECKGKILDRYKSANIYMMSVQVATSLKKAQRREFYRLNYAMEMEFRPLEQAEINSVEHGSLRLLKGKTLMSGIVVDLSGGGMRFVADTAYEPGTLLYCTYTLQMKNEEKEYHMAAKVMRSQPVKGRDDEYENRIQYVNLDVNDREEIIRFIFEEERRQRRNAASR